MAKGSAMGLWRGKKGSTVFYKIKNSNSAQKQGMRERVYEVSNPKSYAQASQRMKLAPAQRIASALKPIIERSFEGIAYGDASRRYFLKRALSLPVDEYPAILKNENLLVPVPFELSRGSLPSVSVTLGDPDDVLTSLVANGQPTTIGELSQTLLETNAFLQAGMQITLVGFFAYTENSTVLPDTTICRYTSFYLNVDDITPIIRTNYNGFIIANTNDFMAFRFAEGNRDWFPLAAAVIISQESPTPLRSSATLAVYTEALKAFYSPLARRRARQSYMKVADTSTDWPVENVATINVKAEPTAGGSVSGAANYVIGELATIVATPATGYVFDGWFKDNQLVSNDATYQFEATEAAGGLYVAQFAQNS